MADTTTAPIEIEVQLPRYLQNIRERKLCFQRSPLRERCLTSFFGLLGGFALGIVVAFALDANTQDAFMPLIIHRAIYISLLPGLIGFFGLTCGFGVVEVCCCGCRTGFPERCGGKACSICCGLLWPSCGVTLRAASGQDPSQTLAIVRKCAATQRANGSGG